MKKIIFFITTIFLLAQCDDGDFDVPSFVFEDNIGFCGDLVIHNIGKDDSEALILELPVTNSLDSVFLKTEMIDKEFSLTDKILYRVFDDDVDANYFCQTIPPSSPSIVNEWIGSGKLIVNNTIIEDDLDGIEELDHSINSDANNDNPDDIPDYLDIDDDNDGVLTKDEIKINDDGTSSFLDTDGDGTPNHLDADDDDDNIPTIDEINDDNGDLIPDYLDSTIAVVQATSGTVEPNKHNLHYTMSFVIENMSLVNSSGNAINYSNYEYGVKVGNIPITD